MTQRDAHNRIPLSPGKQLLAAARGGFISNGTSLARWCAEVGLRRQHVTDALAGRRNGPRAEEMRGLVIAFLQKHGVDI